MTYKTQHDVINSRATNEEDKTKEIHEYTRARVDVLQQIWMKKQKGRKIPHKKYCRKNIPFFNHPTQPAASERPERKCQFRDVPRLRLPPENPMGRCAKPRAIPQNAYVRRGPGRDASRILLGVPEPKLCSYHATIFGFC